MIEIYIYIYNFKPSWQQDLVKILGFEIVICNLNSIACDITPNITIQM